MCCCCPKDLLSGKFCCKSKVQFFFGSQQLNSIETLESITLPAKHARQNKRPGLFVEKHPKLKRDKVCACYGSFSHMLNLDSESLVFLIFPIVRELCGKERSCSML